jgi:hypothetical protein
MVQFLFLEPPADDCLFNRLFPLNSPAYQYLLSNCAEQQIRVFTLTAVRKGVPISRAMAQPLLNFVNLLQQANYTFADLPIRLQKPVSQSEIQDQLRNLNQLRQELYQAADTSTLIKSIKALQRTLRWFQLHALPLLFHTSTQHYDFAIPSPSRASYL